jgi:hypothetical protein
VANVIAYELEHLTRRPYLPGYLLSELTHHPGTGGPAPGHGDRAGGATVRERVLGTLGAQITEEVAAGRMRPIAAEQFLVNLIALCVFPFAARPMVEVLLGHDASGFAAFIAERRASLPAFFLAGLRP